MGLQRQGYVGLKTPYVNQWDSLLAGVQGKGGIGFKKSISQLFNKFLVGSKDSNNLYILINQLTN